MRVLERFPLVSTDIVSRRVLTSGGGGLLALGRVGVGGVGGVLAVVNLW